MTWSDGGLQEVKMEIMYFIIIIIIIIIIIVLSIRVL
jgi:hypothetical protein